jgi:hypothetical protein
LRLRAGSSRCSYPEEREKNISQATVFEVSVRHGRFGAEMGRDLSKKKYYDKPGS